MIDTHTHVYEPEFEADRAEVMARAETAGVEVFMLPAIDRESYGRMFEMSRKSPNCKPMMGLHPTSVNDNPDYREDLALVEQLLKGTDEVDRFYGVGEVGLDLYWSKEWQREQTEVFERQVELSLEYDLPLVIHVREAWGATLDVLERFRGRGVRGIMHAFTSNVENYRKVKRLGDFKFGIGGVVTYKNSGLAATVAEMALEDLVLETDAPYLTPVPFRGKRNEPSYLVYICEKIAEAKGISSEQVARQTTENAATLFGV